MTIDTLEYVKKLEAAGVDRKAAEAHAAALRAAIEDELATKSDILRLETAVQRLEASTKAEVHRLEAKISEFKTELEAKITDFKAEMMKYMVAQTFVIVGVVFLRFVR